MNSKSLFGLRLNRIVDMVPLGQRLVEDFAIEGVGHCTRTVPRAQHVPSARSLVLWRLIGVWLRIRVHILLTADLVTALLNLHWFYWVDNLWCYHDVLVACARCDRRQERALRLLSALVPATQAVALHIPLQRRVQALSTVNFLFSCGSCLAAHRFNCELLSLWRFNRNFSVLFID